MLQTSTHLFFSRSYLSNWYKSLFTFQGHIFSCVEQCMMWSKANLFEDTEMKEKILKEPRPWKQKQLGRLIKNFDQELWDMGKEDIVFRCCYPKFNQNKVLGLQLLATDPLILVEASPWDKIWGCGLAETDPLIVDPLNWTGLNLLGITLMKVREELKNGG